MHIHKDGDGNWTCPSLKEVLEKVGLGLGGGEETRYVFLSFIVLFIGRAKGQLFTQAEKFCGNWIDSFYD